MKLYLEKTHHKKELVKWPKVFTLSSSPSIAKEKKEKNPIPSYAIYAAYKRLHR
jgi:hypothetical protein